MPTTRPLGAAPLRPLDDFSLADTDLLAPEVPNAWAASQERFAREKASGFKDYLGSMWRQDSAVDGFIGNLVGSQMLPDENYNSFTDPGLKELQQGLRPDLQNQLYQAHSAGHAWFLRGRMLQKQEDEARLADMGAMGTAGRLGLGLVSPDQLLLGVATGGVSRVAQGYRASRALKLAADGTKLARLEAAAGNTASTFAAAGTGKAVALGVGFGAAENMAYEKLRQSVSFEDEYSGVLMAGLTGSALSLPFAMAGARGARRAAVVADREVAVLKALRKVDEGGELTPAEGLALKDLHQRNEVIHALETGRMSADQAATAMDELHGPHEPMERWLGRYSERLTRDTEDYLNANFPGRNGRATGRAETSPAAKARMDQAVDLEAATHFPAWDDVSPGPKLETALPSAFKKALMDREASRKGADLAALDSANTAAKVSQRDSAFAAAEADAARAKEGDFHRAEIERQNQLATGEAATSMPVKPPAPEHRDWVGKAVSWADEEGHTVEGTATSFNESIGKLIIRTSDGMKAVFPEHLDQYVSQAPEGFGKHTLSGAMSGRARFQTAAEAAAEVPLQRTAMAEAKGVPTRFDYYALLNGSKVMGVREWAYKLIKDAIQNDDHVAQARTASEWAHHLDLTVRGRFMADSKEALVAAVQAVQVPPMKRLKFEQDFFALVHETAGSQTLIDTVDAKLRPHVQKAAGAYKKFFADYLAELKKAGVKGAEDIQPNEFYTTRQWDHHKLREAALKHGDSSVIDLIAAAILDKKGTVERMRKAPGTTEVRDTLTNSVIHAGKSDTELLRIKAQRFLETIKALEFSPALREVHLAGRDMATVRRELSALGVDGKHVDEFVDLMFEVRPQEADAGRAANLKFRFQLDPDATLMTRAGELRLADLAETDARKLASGYSRTMGGHIGLAKHGIPGQADWTAAMRRIEEEAKGDLGLDGNALKKDLERLSEVHRHILGRPTSDAPFSRTEQIASTVRAVTRATVLPQLGIPAAFEFSKAAAMFGFTTMMRQLPSMRHLIRALRQGHVPDDNLLQQVRMMQGFGNEKAMQFYRAQDIEEGFMGKMLSKAENGANRLSYATDQLSGNASITSLTRQASTVGALQDFNKHARLGRKLSEKKARRWVGQGIGADDLDDVMKAFKDHTDVDSGGAVSAIRYEEWQKADQKTYDLFSTFLSRQTRDAVQDHDFGETMPWMHTPLGKVFAELKTFMLVGHAKNFLKQGFHADGTSLAVWSMGFVAEALAYSLQAAINSPTELDKKLTPDAIARAAFFRMASLGTMSTLVNSGYYFLSGGESLVQPGMTANTDSRNALVTPSMQVVNGWANVLGTGTGMLLGTGTTTQKEAREMGRAVPVLGRFYGVRGAVDWWAQGFPKAEPMEAR